MAGAKKLQTPKNIGVDKIITKDYVGVPLMILAVEPTKTQYGDAFIAKARPANNPKAKPVSVLIGASVLVKTIQQVLADDPNYFPAEATCVKAKGVRYFVFE